MLLALNASKQSALAPIVNLSNINPYVTAALTDWRQNSSSSAFVPRQLVGSATSTVRFPISGLEQKTI